MKKYVFYKGLNECDFSVCQEFIDWKTSFFLKVLLSHAFLGGKFTCLQFYTEVGDM